MKLTYSGNYHDFNKLVKQLDNRVNIDGVSAPVETVVNGLSPANELSNVYHDLKRSSDKSTIGFKGTVEKELCRISSYLEEYHKSPYQD